MKKLIKIAIGVGVSLVGLIIVIAVALFMFIDSAARRAVEEGSAYALQVPTQLDSADVKVFGGSLAMSGLTVSNPEGFDTPHFLKLADAGVAVDVGSLSSDVVDLPTLTLTDLDVYLERKQGQTNYQVILDNLKRFESGDAPKDDPEASPGKQVTIQRVEIRNIRAHVRLLPVGGERTEAEVVVPEIILEHVGSDGSGASIGEVTNIILKAVFASILATGENVLPADMLQDLQQSLAGLTSLSEQGVALGIDLGEGVKSIDALDSITDEAEKAVEDLDDTVRNLIGGG